MMRWRSTPRRSATARRPDQWSALYRDMLGREQPTLDLARQSSNLVEIASLKHNLNRWANEPTRYTHLGSQYKRLRQIYETMRAVLAQKG